MFNFYTKKSRWLRVIPLAMLMSLVGSVWSYAATYYSKAASTNFADVASWGANTDGSGAAPGSISNADDFIIQNGSAMVLNATAAVRTLTINAGSLTVSANTLTVAIAGVNNSNLTVNTGGTLTVSGGTVNVDGQFAVLGTAAFNQSAGSINVDGNAAGVSANSVASGSGIVRFTSSVLNLTGGTLTIVDPHANTTASFAFDYNTGTSYNSGAGHTFRFGNGVSTDAGGNATNGFRHSTWTGSGRFLFGAVVVDALAGTNRFITSNYSHGMASLTVNSGDYRTTSAPCAIAGNITVNASGTLTANSTLQLSTFLGGTSAASPNAQTISGTGVFRNLTASPTANFTNLTINNSNATGVTFSGANSMLSGAVTGTVSGTLNFTTGKVTCTGGTFILGISAATPGTFTYTAGGFTSGSTFRRWLATTTLTTSATPTTNAFPFVVGNLNRNVRMNKVGGNLTTGGWIEATHTDASGLAAAGFLDGAYSVDQRTNASWTMNSGGGIALGARTLAVGLNGEGLIVTAAAPGTAPRLVQAAGAVKTHSPGLGSTSAPIASRVDFVLADLAGPHYIGIANADIGLYSVASGNWNVGGTWSTGSVPTASDNPLIASGTTVTVNSSVTCLTATVAGTLTVSGGGTIDVVGASVTGVAVNAGGTLNLTGGTVNVGPQDNSFCNRRLSVANGGTLSVSTGNLNVAGSLVISSGGTIAQSGGTIRVDGNAAGVSANSVAAGNIVDFTIAAQANLNLTGGTILIVDPHTLTGTTNRAFGNQTGANVTCGVGHTFQFGDGISTDATANTGGFVQETYIGSTRMLYGNLIINSGSTGNRALITQQYTGQFVGVEGNMTITSGDYRNTGTLTVAGNLVNNGTLTSTGTLAMSSSSGTGTFATSTTASTISGSGTFQNAAASPTAELVGFRIQNSSVAGVTMSLPLSMSGTLTMAEGKLTTTATNLLTMTATTSSVSSGTTTAGYVSGPIRRTVPASTTNASYFFPVGQNSANWFAIYNWSTNAGGPVVVDVSGDNTVNAPNTFDGSLTSLTLGREWTTTIVSGAANMTTYSMQGYDAAMISGNALAGIQSPATDFSVLGTGSNFGAAAAPLSQNLTTTLPPLAGSTFPDRVSYGNTGPLNVSGATAFQVTGAVSIASTNNDLTRLVVSCVGSSGTVTLTDLIYTYTGTNAADIAANGITLWTGTFSAPVAQVGSGVSLSGGFATFSGLTINIPSGATYLWIRANTSASATIGNVIDGKVETGNMSFAVSGGATFTPPIPAADLDPAGTRLIDYCQAVFTNDACTSDDYLAAFSLNTLSATPTCGGGAPNNYEKLVATTSLQQGNAYTANFTNGIGGAEGVAIWFDFNHDGDFADAGEFFATAGTTASGAAGTLGVTIDPAALTGLTRMRVMNRWNTTFVQGDVCLNPINYGTTVDYDVTITSPTPRSLDPITSVQQTGGIGQNTTNNNLLRIDIPTSGSLGTLTLSQIRFTYTGTTSADIAALGATLWTGTTGGPVTQIGSAVTFGATANFTGLSVSLGATNYLWLRVNSSVAATIANLVDAKVVIGDMTITAAGGATAPGSQPTADIDPAGERFIDYCIPTYATGCNGGDPITNVTLAGNSITLNNTSACTANPYYTYYNAASVPDLYPGVTYPISITFGTDGTQWSGVWLDFDQDGQLETSEYFAPVSSAGSNGTSTFNIVVPTGATLGNTRMRVRGGNDAALTSAQACGASSSGFGETEDYIVSIIPPPNCSTALPFPATAATASTTTVCSGSSVTFGITVAMPAATGITYQWRRNGSNIGGSSSSSTSSIAVTLGGNYDVVISCNGTPQVTSSAVAITVFTPSVTGSTPATKCGPGSVTLSATGSAGTTLKWYDVATGGSALTNGGSYVTPDLAVGTTPYYVAATQVYGTENVGKPAFIPGTGFITTNWGIVFTANNDIILNTVDIYPFGTGDLVIGLYDASLSLITETPAIPFTGTTGGLETVNLNFDVPAGVGYRLLVKSYSGLTGLGREGTGIAFPYNSASGAATVTSSEWGGTTTTTNYFFYNLNISSLCASARTLVNATITVPPVLNVIPTNPILCAGESTNAAASGTGYTGFTWTPALTVAPAGPGASKVLTPTSTTTYTVVATGGGCTNSKSMTIQVKPTPSTPIFTTTTPAGGFCLGGTKTLTASSTANGDLVLFRGDFDDNSLTGYSLTSGGGTPTNWVLSSGTYTYGTQITSFAFSGSSPFIYLNSDQLGSGSSAGFGSIATPSFSTVGHTGITLKFNHVYRTTGANIAATIQYSTDGGLTWSANVVSYTATTPTQTWNAASIQTEAASIALPAGANNQPNVKVRFTCDYDWDYYWMIDNIEVVVPSTVEYRWSSAFAFAGIPAPSQSYSGANATMVATPSQGSAITYEVQVRNSTGCVAASTLTHSANVSQVVASPSNTSPQREGTVLTINGNVSGGFGGYTYNWYKQPDLVTVVNSTPSFSIGGALAASSGTYQLNVVDGQGCSVTATTDALVYAALVWNGSVSSDWNTAANWTPSIVPANGTDCTTPLSRDNVVITNLGTPPVYPGAGVFVDNFGVESGQINLNNNVRVCGALNGGTTLTGSVLGTGTVELVGSGNNVVGGLLELDRLIINKSGAGVVQFQGTTYINDLMTVTAAPGGINVLASGNVVLVSTALQTGKIGPIPAATPIAVTGAGKFTQQRYVSFPGGSEGDWYFLASPMQSKNFTDWADDFRVIGLSSVLGGFGGQGGDVLPSNEPERNTIFSYNEAANNAYVDTVRKRGWTIPAAAATITTGQGYRVFVKKEANPLFDNQGLIYSGDKNMTITRTENATCQDGITLSTAVPCTETWRGWNLLGNPYPCDIDWDAAAAAWTKPGQMQNAWHRWNSAGQGYGLYTNGVGYVGAGPAPSNPNVIPSSQAFFVKAAAAGNYSAVLTVTEAAKITATAGQFARVNAATQKLRISLSKSMNPADYGYDAVIRFMPEATDNYDFSYDFESLGGNNFNLGIPVDQSLLAVASFAPISDSKIVPISINYKGASGSFYLKFSQMETLLEDNAIFLRDNLNGTIQEVTPGFVYNYSVSSTDGLTGDRFELIFNPTVVTGVTPSLAAGAGLNVFPNPNALGKATNVAIKGFDVNTADVVVYDAVGRVVFSKEVALTNGAAQLEIKSELPAGVYTVKAIGGSLTLTQKLAVR